MSRRHKNSSRFAAVDPRRSEYDAIKSNGKRQAPSGLLRSEDRELLPSQRRLLVSGTRDIHRNFAIAAWAVRKHLDYVSTFSFRADTGNEALDDRIEELVAWASLPENFDIAGRHDRQRYTRLKEARRVVDGDCFSLKLESGHLQAIEGDRVRSANDLPDTVDSLRFYHGVEVNENGAAVAYSVYNRSRWGAFIFDKIIPSEFMIHHAFFDRFDQTRGVSPIAAALNSFRDTYEGFDYALAKMKVSQLFALAITRGAADDLGVITGDDTDGDGKDDDNYKVDFGKGPQLLDLDPGDDAKFLGENTPSMELQQFAQLIISVSLKSLDIPYSFFAENFTNYSGQRQGLLLYEQSAESKRNDVKAWLNAWAGWRLAMFVADGVLKLPAGLQFKSVRWHWTPAGMPWIDPLKETTADVTAIENGLNSPQRVAARNGDDPYQILKEIAQWNQWRVKLGLPPIMQGAGNSAATSAALAMAANGVEHEHKR